MTSKAELRREVLARRDREPDRAAKSGRIARTVYELAAFQDAGSILFYVGVRSEVATEPLLRRARIAGKRTAVVFVDGDRLGAAWIEAPEELVPAAFGLREPPPALRADPDRRCLPSDVDLVLVPGVAFDKAGGRLGYGRGYYDRLLRTLRPDAAVVALAFACQLVSSVPMGPDDVSIPTIVTETGVIEATLR